MIETIQSLDIYETPIGKESALKYPYSSIVILPYTSRISGVAGNRIVGEKFPREARIRLSSFSAMVTAAAEKLYNGKVAPHIIALGENTFGKDYPSTAELMKEQLVKRGIPQDAVTVLGNLADTDEQLKALKAQDGQLTQNPLFVIMDFHKGRVAMILAENQIPGTTRSAEDVFMEYFRDNYKGIKEQDPEKYEALIKHHNQQLKQFTPLKVRIAESVFRTAAKLGPLSDVLLLGLRKVRGGHTITDYHSLTSADAHMAVAIKAISEGELRPAKSKKEGIVM